MVQVKLDDLEIDTWGEYYEWQGKPFTGIAYDLYSNGQKCIEIEVVDGFEEGAVRQWYSSGEIKLEGSGKFGEPFTWSKEWFENGVLKRETLAEFHIRVKETVWNENGQIISEYERSPLDRKLIESSKAAELNTLKQRKELSNR